MTVLNRFFGNDGLGSHAELADTPILDVIPAQGQGNAQLLDYLYTPGSASHILYGMRPLARTYLAANAAASQAVIVLAVDPGAAISNAIAGNDYLVIRRDDGTQIAVKVSSVTAGANGQQNVTLTASLAVAISAGATVWFYGIKTDTDPVTGSAHPTFALATGAQREVGNGTYPVLSSHQNDQPLLLLTDNVTNAGTMNRTAYCYSIN